ncbi:MAG: protein kinase [Planctomycetota bacterium]|nr:protein kinase [Planctomycetota bacterium]
MTIHCPRCEKSFEKSHFPLGSEVACIYCGMVFALSTKETVPMAPVKVAVEPEASRVHNSQLTPLPGVVGPGGQLAGYVLERELGRGGMGVVYLATQESLGRKVAVKVLPQRLSEDESFVRRFDREAQSLAKLNHAGIVSILDKGQEGGTYYFVMEYVDGVSLREILEEKRLTPQEALRIVGQICNALEYAHDEGVVHRDIKPENILIDRKGNAKIADFGLARLVRGDVVQNRITRSQVVMGSPDYMAPEQREDARQVDHRADLYSLGVVLYEMLTGELPLGNFPPPSEINIGLDVDLDRIVLKVLQKDPARRYSKASEVATEIEGLSAGNGRARTSAPGGEAADQVTDRNEILEFAKENPWIIAIVIGGAIGIFAVNAFWGFILLVVLGGIFETIWKNQTRASHWKKKAKQEKRRADSLASGETSRGPAAAPAGRSGPKPGVPFAETPGYSFLAPFAFLFAGMLLTIQLALMGISGLGGQPVYVILGALFGFTSLILSFFARGRATRLRQQGKFFGTLGIVISLIFLGGIFWYGT